MNEQTKQAISVLMQVTDNFKGTKKDHDMIQQSWNIIINELQKKEEKPEETID